MNSRVMALLSRLNKKTGEVWKYEIKGNGKNRVHYAYPFPSKRTIIEGLSLADLENKAELIKQYRRRGAS